MPPEPAFGEPRVLHIGQLAGACGGSFRLDQPANLGHSEALAAGWIADLVQGSRQIVVRGPTSSEDYYDTLDEALAAAQEALDLLAMRAVANHVIEGSDSSHTIWWRKAGATIVRIVSVSDLGVSMSASVTVIDKNGNVVPAPTPSVLAWHPSLRYFRLSQMTSDLFDAYRNMYLALEAMLSTIVPQLISSTGKPAEPESAWLKRALQQVDSTLPLATYAPAGSTDPVSDVFHDLYAGTRTGLFHAKSGRQVLLPHGSGSRVNVLESLERLSRLFMDLFNSHFDFQKPSGAMTYAGFELATQWEAEAVVSDDPAPEDRSDTRINPSGWATSLLPTVQAPELSQPGLKVWLGERLASEVRATVSVIRRIGLQTGGALVQVDRLDDPLSVEGIDFLQVQQGLRLENLQLPRFRFQT